MVPDFVHPVHHKPIREMLANVLRASPVGSPAMIKVMPFPAYPRSVDRAPPVASAPDVPHTHTYWTFPPSGTAVSKGQISTPRRTHLMATLNVTPDSFSDGADHPALPEALTYAASSVHAGAHIIDVGGYSTRPGAAQVSPQDEISRVAPVTEGVHVFRSGTADGGNVGDVFIRVHVPPARRARCYSCKSQLHQRCACIHRSGLSAHRVVVILANDLLFGNRG